MYFVFELQKNNQGQSSCLVYHDDSWTYQQAESTFFTKCASAAISNIPTHTIILADVQGSVYNVKTYDRIS